MRKKSLGGYGKAWDSEVEGFDDFQSVVIPKKDEMLQTITEMIPFDTERKLTILEIGAGNGALTQKVLSYFPKSNYIFSDASEGMLEEARKRFEGKEGAPMKFVIADFNKSEWYAPLGKLKFDVIVSSLCFHYIATKRRQPLFNEILELLKKKGVLIYSTAVESPHKIIQKQIEKNHRLFLKRRFKEVMNITVTDEDMDKMYKEKRGRLGVNTMPAENHLYHMKKAGFSKYELIWRFRHYAIFMGVK
ncbi:MAG: class I SAM-dependent methyltransferase [Candidatus Schekmanbacteria bacterium]|nr:MAG: class I SAM-dependent methyltransferase [Candidatus Schekmanbacteria bacterium]